MFSIWGGNYHGMDHRYKHPHLIPHTIQPQPHPSQSLDLDSPAKEDLGHVEVAISKNKLCVKLDTAGFSPEEMEIKTLDGFLIIQGETRESGGEGFKTSRRFRRRFLLPVNCKEDELHCELGGIHDSSDTILRVTIPRDVPDGKGKLHRISMSGGGLPSTHVTSHPYPLHHRHPAVNGYWVSGVEVNKDQFVLRLELPRFSPDEILVKTVDDFLVIEGNQGEKEEEGGNNGGAFASYSFNRRYLLPVNADVEGLNCEISEDGRLKVVVPRINLGKMDQVKVHRVERKTTGLRQAEACNGYEKNGV